MIFQEEWCRTEYVVGLQSIMVLFKWRLPQSLYVLGVLKDRHVSGGDFSQWSLTFSWSPSHCSPKCPPNFCFWAQQSPRISMSRYVWQESLESSCLPVFRSRPLQLFQHPLVMGLCLQKMEVGSHQQPVYSLAHVIEFPVADHSRKLNPKCVLPWV